MPAHRGARNQNGKHENSTNYGTEGVGVSQFFLEPKTAWRGATQFSSIASLRQSCAAEIVIFSSVKAPNVLRFERTTNHEGQSHSVTRAVTVSLAPR